MPVYEYRCEDCGEKFDIIATFSEKEAGLSPVCPKCRSTSCSQVFGRVTILTSSKSEDDFDDDFGDDDLGDSGSMDEGDEGTDDFEDEDFG